MRVIDFTNLRTGYTFARRSSTGVKYNYYVRWHDGSVDIWPVIKTQNQVEALREKKRGCMSDDTVISMADAACDGTLQTPEQALQDAFKYIDKQGAFKNGKKLLILSLDDTEGNYTISFIQAGMKMSECLTLCDVAKTLFLTEMNYIPGAENI